MNQASQAMAMFGATTPGATPPAPPPPMEREFAVASVTVAGEDINGLVITGMRGAKASGRIVFEGGAKPESLASLRLMATPTDPDNIAGAMAAFGIAAVKDGGTFEIDGLVGRRLFGFMEAPKGWFIKRVTQENVDVTDTGYDFKPGEDVSGFEIVLTTKSQTVSGSVTNDKNEAVKEYTVVVFPEDPQKWTTAAVRFSASARPDQQGHYRVANLPPGAYLAIAVEYVEQGEWTDPEWLARAAKKATKFTLDEGAARTLDLKISGS
jgi:hypothetical protein